MDAINFNGKLFVHNDTHFHPTAYGFYKRVSPRGFVLMDMQRTPRIAVVNTPDGGPILVTCHQTNAGIRYMYALSTLDQMEFGVPLSYIKGKEQASTLYQQLSDAYAGEEK